MPVFSPYNSFFVLITLVISQTDLSAVSLMLFYYLKTQAVNPLALPINSIFWKITSYDLYPHFNQQAVSHSCPLYFGVIFL